MFRTRKTIVVTVHRGPRIETRGYYLTSVMGLISRESPQEMPENTLGRQSREITMNGYFFIFHLTEVVQHMILGIWYLGGKGCQIWRLFREMHW